MSDANSRASTRAGTETPPAPADSTPQPTSVVYTLTICLTFIAVSASLINFNKFMMNDDHFPFSTVLTCMHMTGSFLFCSLFYAFFGESWFPSMPMVKENKATIGKKLVPLSIAFALSIALSNEAYRYSSVPFLQMCKELNVVLVYGMGLLLMVEKWNLQIATILMVIVCGATMSIHGEINYSAKGLGLQLGCQFFEVFKIITQQQVLQGLRVDPLTMVMCMAPLCVLTLAPAAYFAWTPAVWVAMKANAPLLALNCLNAFALNVTVSFLIKAASGLSMVICGVVKDITIVLTAVVLLASPITRLQTIGFSFAVMGVAVYSIIRSNAEMANKHGVYGTLVYATTGVTPGGKSLREDQDHIA